MASIKELIQSIEAADSSFDEKLAAITKMEETLVAMRAQEEQAVQDNVDLIVEAIKVMERKVERQLEVAKSIVPEKGDKGDRGERGLDGANGLNGKDGRDGINGRDGQDGQDGVSVTDAKIDFDGSLIITLSTGQEINVGEVVAPELQEKIKLVTSGGAGTVLPDQAGNSGKVLGTNGSVLSWVAGGGGSGTVTSVAATGGTGISVTGSPITTSGTLNITNTAPDQTVALTQGGTTTITGTYPNFTISSADQYSGTVTSVGLSGGTTGLTTTGSPITTTGTITLSGTLAVANGGTSQTSYTDGQLLIGNSTGNTLTKTTLTAGTGVSITNGSGSISIASPLAKQTDVFTSGTSATYTAPANTQWVKITVVGKGGNGGGTTSQRGSGGGAGGIAIKWLAITAGQTLIYTVNNASFPNFVTSGTYTLASDITGYGGTAGTSVAYAASFTAGGLGGTATGGDINIRGGYGGSAFGTSTAVTTQQSGFGGSNMFGAGGSAVGVAINAGVDGLGYGVGGGGSIGSTTVGSGTNGVIIFEAY
jgi:hypothetical protein